MALALAFGLSHKRCESKEVQGGYELRMTVCYVFLYSSRLRCCSLRKRMMLMMGNYWDGNMGLDFCFFCSFS